MAVDAVAVRPRRAVNDDRYGDRFDDIIDAEDLFGAGWGIPTRSADTTPHVPAPNPVPARSADTPHDPDDVFRKPAQPARSSQPAQPVPEPAPAPADDGWGIRQRDPVPGGRYAPQNRTTQTRSRQPATTSSKTAAEPANAEDSKDRTGRVRDAITLLLALVSLTLAVVAVWEFLNADGNYTRLGWYIAGVFIALIASTLSIDE